MLDENGNFCVTMINRDSNKKAEISLILPEDDLAKGEYCLWTEDGTYDLGFSCFSCFFALSRFDF